MITILVDHNIKGQAALLWNTFVTFVQVGLAHASSDRIVWQFAQTHAMLLLTGNRNMDDQDSLKQTIRDSNYALALPVLTIGNVDRISNDRVSVSRTLRHTPCENSVRSRRLSWNWTTVSAVAGMLFCRCKL